MNDIALVKHLISINNIAEKAGILQLEDFNESSNKYLLSPVYSYCLKAVISGIDIPKEIETLRTREDMIIIKGFKFIQLKLPIKDIAEKLCSMLEIPLLSFELKSSTNSDS